MKHEEICSYCGKRCKKNDIEICCSNQKALRNIDKSLANAINEKVV